jgi:acetyltransferase-like isoleucine patch superfamily enzyme
LGKKVVFSVGVDPAAPIETVIKSDGDISGTYQVGAKSTFTLEEGVAFEVEENGILDFTQVTTAPATASDPAPILIKGEVVVNGGMLKVAHPTDGSIDDVFTYGENGKIVLEVDGAGSKTEAHLCIAHYVGTVGNGAIYQTDHGVIELSSKKMKLAGGDVIIAQNISIMGGDTVELAAGTTVTIADGVSFKLNAGAKIIGDGKLIAGSTEIMGGWEVQGASTTAPDDDFVTIGYDNGSSANKTTITANKATASLVAIGPGSTITQNSVVFGAQNDLILTAAEASDTPVLDLSAGGALNLAAAWYDASARVPAQITLPQYAIIKLGAGDVDINNTKLKSALGDTINGIEVEGNLTGKTAASANPSALTQIIGAATSGNTITGPKQETATATMPQSLSIKAGVFQADGT